MPPRTREPETPSPVGAFVADHMEASLDDVNIRAEHDRLAPFEALARLVIMRRAALGVSQGELARLMGTTASVISRIESGQHATNTRTLMRIAEALDAQAILGFDYGPGAKPRRELVVLD